MNTKRVLIALTAAALFVWGCGDDDPAAPKDKVKTSVAWTTAGGDFALMATASAQVADLGTYRWGGNLEIKTLVQDWAANPDNDFGLMLLGDETEVSAKRFDSRQNTTPANRPKLIVYHDGGATPTTIPAVKDNTLYEDPEGDRSNGIGEYLFAGLTAEPSDAIRRGLIAFGVADSIAAAATIDSVFLELNMSKTDGHPQAFAVTIHRMTSDWGEGTSKGGRGEGAGGPATSGDATWRHAFYEP